MFMDVTDGHSSSRVRVERPILFFLSTGVMRALRASRMTRRKALQQVDRIPGLGAVLGGARSPIEPSLPASAAELCIVTAGLCGAPSLMVWALPPHF